MSSDRQIVALDNINETLKAIHATLERQEAQGTGFDLDISTEPSEASHDDTETAQDTTDADDGLSAHETVAAVKSLLTQLGVNTEKVEFANLQSEEIVTFTDDFAAMDDDETADFKDVTAKDAHDWIEVHQWKEVSNDNGTFTVPDWFCVAYDDIPTAKAEVFG